jgi:hypothetical protein
MNNKHANNVNLLFSPNAALSTDDLFYYPFFAGASPVCANENGALRRGKWPGPIQLCPSLIDIAV